MAAAVSGFTERTSGLEDQFLSSERPTVPVRSCGFGASARVVARRLLGRDLHLRIGGHQLVGQRHALDDLDALRDERVVFHVAHRDQAIDARDAQPMHDVRHQLLEARVLHAGHAFRALEVAGRRIAALLALPRVVDQELGDLAERAALLAIVDDDAEPAGLRRARALLDAVHEIGPAGADVGAEHVRAVALVVHAAGDAGGRVGKLGDVAEQIDRRAADGRQEHIEVGPRHQLGEHAGRLLEQRAAQARFA